MAAPPVAPGPKTYPSTSLLPGLRGPRDIRMTWGRLTTRDLTGSVTTRALSGRLSVEEE